MNYFSYSKWNVILGWVVFFIALSTYWLTVEPTASFWDAGEYITTSSNLEIGHPPGAPLYQMLGAFFSIFATEASNIALVVNLMSVFASAFTILFMFWSIALLLKKLVSRRGEITNQNEIVILGSALVGSLAFAFTDSFWFNAVEAEVYAMAAFIMSALFYLALLWERDLNSPRGNRWLILISFVIGLSFGVHFMGLLTIPAIGFLYFFKTYKKVTLKNFMIANVVVVAILLFIFKLLLPMTMRFFSASELFFINTIGLPFNSGTVIAGIIFVLGFYYGLKHTRKKHWTQLNTLILCVIFILIGFSSWMMLPIRANARTVINENNPNNARELLAYYNREQYPESHLFYGPQFSEIYAGLDEDNPYLDDKPKYEKDLKIGRYVIVNNYKNARQNTDDAHKAFLPRMWSTEHAGNYMAYTGGLNFKIKREYRSIEELQEEIKIFKKYYNQGSIGYDEYHEFLRNFGDYLDIEKPGFIDNMKYMINFQFGYMYFRYFMWNFVGRQDDIQGQDNNHGHWLSGINFIDELFLDSQDNLPADVKNNKARNTYFFLPLLLGIIGMVFLYKGDIKQFWVLLVFFLFTGLALKIYLNERPFEPRERDYALVGSFYVFAIWIGFGVYALYDIVKDYLKAKLAIPITLGVTLLAAPVLLASQNWDDHDRSNRYTAQAMAKMYLDSCDENAILFTIGDNDTFALWYAQGIEAYRRDIRTVNTSLFQTDWYIDDMKKKAYESDPIPSQLSHEKYRWGTRDFTIYQPLKEDTLLIKDWMNWIASDDPRTKETLPGGQVVNTFISKSIRIPVDKESVLRNGIVKAEDADKIVPYIDIQLKGNILYKNRLLMLDIIANNNWERPIYFTGGSFGDDDYIWMKDYLQLEGVVYKLVPIRTPIDKNNPYEMGRIDSDKMYHIVKKWNWGNSEDPNIYHDTETRRNSITYRGNLARLSETLIKEGQLERAEEILDLAMEKMPVDFYGYYTLLEPYISGYYAVGNTEKARDLFEQVSDKYKQNLNYYNGISVLKQQRKYAQEIINSIERYRGLVDAVIIGNDREFFSEKAKEFNNYLKLFRHFYGEEEEEKLQDDIDLFENDSTVITDDTILNQ